MGLGKTLQAIAFIQYMKEHPDVVAPHNAAHTCLVVCPLSVLSTWIREAQEWAPELSTLNLHGSTAQLKDMRRQFHERSDIDLVVTSYETFQTQKTWFMHKFWRCIILDEAHYLKDHASKVAKSLKNVKAGRRIMLTGTPLQNDLKELWSMLHWLFQDVFDEKTASAFSESFNLSKGRVDKTFFQHVSKLLELIALQRTKATLGPAYRLPPRKEVLLQIPLAPAQRECYKMLGRIDDNNWQDMLNVALKEDNNAALPQYATRGDPSSAAQRAVKNLLMQLRKCCNHPQIVTDSGFSGEQFVQASSKLIILQKLVEQLVRKERKKMLIFSGFVEMLDICQNFLASFDDFEVLCLDGSTCVARKNLAMRLLNDGGSSHRVMLISTRAGGLGITLTGASEFVMLDQDWNPQETAQAEARVHRIGQTKPVTIWKLLCQGTIEPQMLERIQKKNYMAATINNAKLNIYGTSTSLAEVNEEADESNMGHVERTSLVRSSLQALARPMIDIQKLAAWDLAETIEKCQVDLPECSERGSTEAVDAETEEEWLNKVERVQTREFGGKVYPKKPSSTRFTSKMGDLGWIQDVGNKASRRLGKETITMIDGYPVRKNSLPVNAPSSSPNKRRRNTISHQEHCQVCFSHDADTQCTSCPRSYHDSCLGQHAAKNGRNGLFHCPQHRCCKCVKSAEDAAGMLYRCQACPRAWCEDCMDFERTELVGDTTAEYKSLGMPLLSSTYYVRCAVCIVQGEVEYKKRGVEEAGLSDVCPKRARLEGPKAL